jgi:hypothetical protein
MFWLHDTSIRWYDLIGWLRRRAGLTVGYPNLGQAVRWADDPTRQMVGPSIVKFGASMAARCERIARQRDLTAENGLLCNSHFGEMQFFHAQAADSGEAAVDTHDKVFGWAEFLFRVAAHMTDEELNTPYCDYFARRNVFHEAMLPSPRAFHCGEPGRKGWTLTTLFNLKCDNMFSSLECDEVVDATRFDRARIYAAGAILHMIQDSYSQSHCERGDCRGPRGKPVSKVECVPITMFTTYRGQVDHGAADWEPDFADSCHARAAIDDPITASAVALWHIQKKSPVEIFLADLHRVFSTRADIVRDAVPAGAGKCFGDSVDAA